MSSCVAFVVEPVRRGRVLVLALALALGIGRVPASAQDEKPAPTQAARAPGVQDVLARFASRGALRARFRESKQVTFLRTPLVSTGEVFFTKPGWIVRKTDKPEPSTMLLRDGQLTLVESSGKRVIDVGASPVLRAFVESFVHVLSGDRAALERDYTLSLELTPDGAFRLQLTPKSSTLARFLSSLRFEGRGSTVERMVLTEASGDVSTTEFSVVQTLAAFPPAERDRLFAVPR